MGDFLYDMGVRKEAIEYYEEARKILVEGHPEVGPILCRIGYFYKAA
eukprot:CAMPEP_0170303548 /NCGR_PEP_ID=MMETSP0116_2-20130129/52096_1 /TAXON_ID=400756 /ORGANISM="Durinskia baltica, Strain CSIRO CS-38" /LENGTH=46 /DNA_ID= /DNA_START= /DNA_END= /DNA_ORIENTATION=